MILTYIRNLGDGLYMLGRLDRVWNQFNNEFFYTITDEIVHNFNLNFNINLSSIIFHVKIILFKTKKIKFDFKSQIYNNVTTKSLSLQLFYSVNHQQISPVS